MYEGALKKIKLTGRSIDGHLGITRDSTEQNSHCNNCGAVEASVPSVEKDFAPSLKPTTEVPPSSFEFYVWSDEGINLHVDLNSSPSDWTNRFKNEVCISENVYGNEPQSLLQDLGCFGESSTRKSSFLWNTNSGQINDHNGQTKSSPSLELTKDDIAGLDQQDIADSSDPLMSYSMSVIAADNLKDQSIVSAEPTVNMADNSKEDQSIVSAEISYGAPNNIIFGAEFYAKDASKEILASDVTNAPLIKSFCGSFGNSLSEPGTFEHQNLKPDDDIFEDFTLLGDSCLEDTGVVCLGASVSSSMELQISEVASCHKYGSVSICENDGSLDLIDRKNTSDTEQGGLVNSNEVNLEIDGNSFPSLTEEWEVGKIGNGREISECSQFDDPLKKSSLDSDVPESGMELHKKRKHVDSDVEDSSFKPVTKSSRRMNYAVGMVLPRRSMRLISKVASFFRKNYTQQ